MERVFAMYEGISTFCDELENSALEGLCDCVSVGVIELLGDKVERFYLAPSSNHKLINTEKSQDPGYGLYRRTNENIGFLVDSPYHLHIQPIGTNMTYKA